MNDKSHAPGRNNNTIASVVAEVFITKLKKGIIPWRQPWVFDKLNYVSGNQYSGIIRWLIYGDDRAYLTAKQIENLGGSLREGCGRGYRTLFYLPARPKKGRKRLTEEEPPVHVWRRVWGLSQIKGIQFRIPEPEIIDPNAALDDLGRACRYPILHDRNTASFDGSAIHLPHPEQFETTAGYYCTLFHEIGHSLRDRKKPLPYALEELVAELFSSMCLNFCGIEDTKEIIDEPAAYCAHYIELFKAQPSIMFKAAAKAEKRFWTFLERAAKLEVSRRGY